MKGVFGAVIGLILLAGCRSPLIEGGKIHLRDGRYDQAQGLFRRAAQENPNSAEAHFWLGVASVRCEEYRLAAESFDKAFALDSSYLHRLKRDEANKVLVWAGYAGAGSELAEKKEYEAALLWLERAREVDPDQPETYPTLAQVYIGLGRFEELLQTADELLRLNPKSPEAYTLRGIYFFHQESLQLAREGYGRAAELYKERFDQEEAELGRLLGLEAPELRRRAQRLMGLHRAGEGLDGFLVDSLKVAQAVVPRVKRQVEELTKEANQLSLCYTQLGTIALKLDESTEAEGCFEKALEFDPGNPDATYNLGVTRYRLDKLEEALKAFEQALRLFPDDEWLWIYLAEVRLRLKDYAGTIEACEEVLKINPESGEAYRLMGYAYREQRDTEKATQMLRRWLELSKKRE